MLNVDTLLNVKRERAQTIGLGEKKRVGESEEQISEGVSALRLAQG